MSMFDKGDIRMGILRISARVVLAIVVISASAHTAGFENSGLGVQARAMGGAFRGVANDWTATFYNPAGLAYISDNQWGVDAAFLHHRNELTPDYSFGGLNTKTGFDNGSRFFNKHEILTNPTAGVVGKLPLFGETVVGLTAYQPFDQNITWDLYRIPTAYNDSIAGPNEQYGVNLDVVSFQLTAARELTADKLAIGLGIQLLRGDLVYKDLMFRQSPVHADAPYWHVPEYLYANGNGWGLGFRLGLMYKVCEKTNLGFTAAVPFNVTIKGDATTTFVMPRINPKTSRPSDTTAEGLFSWGKSVVLQREFETSLNLPVSFGIGVAHRPTEKVLVSLDAEYTLWSSFDGLKFTFTDNPTIKKPISDPVAKPFFLSDVENEVAWKNTLKAAIGCRFDPIHALSVMGGVSYDEGVNPDKVGFIPQFVDTGTKWGYSGGLLLHVQTWDIGVGGRAVTSPDLTIERVYESDGSLQGFPGEYKATTFETVVSVTRRF